jgi:predicted metal-dependent phosphoesterase TrpH
LIDLHSHSIFSDGTDTPEAMAQAAGALGLRALALTDHDTLAGLGRFLAQQDTVQTLLIPGIELSCRYLGRVLHMLGLFVDPGDGPFRARVDRLRIQRVERNQEIVGRLQGMGVSITYEDVATTAPTDLISRTHFARTLVRLGAAGSPQDAFRRFVGDQAPAFVPFPEFTPREAARWIREAGGVALVAHPGRGVPRNFRWDAAMADLKAAGIQGFEAYYPDYGPLEERYFLDLARALDLVPTGGSDYHGTNKPGQALGVGRGGLHVPDEVLDRLQGLLSARQGQ